MGTHPIFDGNAYLLLDCKKRGWDPLFKQRD